jgi:hypothetical protein
VPQPHKASSCRQAQQQLQLQPLPPQQQQQQWPQQERRQVACRASAAAGAGGGASRGDSPLVTLSPLELQLGALCKQLTNLFPL